MTIIITSNSSNRVEPDKTNRSNWIFSNVSLVTTVHQRFNHIASSKFGQFKRMHQSKFKHISIGKRKQLLCLCCSSYSLVAYAHSVKATHTHSHSVYFALSLWCCLTLAMTWFAPMPSENGYFLTSNDCHEQHFGAGRFFIAQLYRL